ncbi:hypothetical protein V1522DRAFT_191694 [Lipomyces starkeyi]
MGRLVKLIGAGIGLTTEAIKSRQSPSCSGSPAAGTSRSASDNVPYSGDPTQSVDLPTDHADQQDHDHHEDYDDTQDSEEHEEVRDEDDWDLDDAVEEYTGSRAAEDQEPPVDTDEVFRTFMAAIPPPPKSADLAKLPCPVIIPQRRPRNKSRGFIRAYAPVLEGCGIDQAMFMNFLKSFHQASKSSPSLDVINLAAFAVGFVPSPTAMAASITVQVAVGFAKEIQARQRTNSFLDKINNEFFMPRGLFCLIMTYKPDQSTPHEIVDISQTVRQTLAPASSTAKEHLKKIRLSSGKTYGEVELPESAPLIFPALDSLASDNGQGHNKFKRSQKFIANYFDRRAQATYTAQNPGSSLAVPVNSQFASRYSDPNHPANSGSLIALVTGGKVDPKRRKRERRARRKGLDPSAVLVAPREGRIKRMLKQDILYLIIVNLPTDDEMEASKVQVNNLMAAA